MAENLINKYKNVNINLKCFFHLKLSIFNKQTLPVENAIPFC